LWLRSGAWQAYLPEAGSGWAGLGWAAAQRLCVFAARRGSACGLVFSWSAAWLSCGCLSQCKSEQDRATARELSVRVVLLPAPLSLSPHPIHPSCSSCTTGLRRQAVRKVSLSVLAHHLSDQRQTTHHSINARAHRNSRSRPEALSANDPAHASGGVPSGPVPGTMKELRRRASAGSIQSAMSSLASHNDSPEVRGGG
jgi:hypothetical protein